MRIIFLNTWFGGRKREEIRQFVQNQSEITDVFCFQEISPDFLKTLTLWLPGFIPHYEMARKLIYDNINYGQVIFTKNNLTVLDTGRVRIYNQLGNDIGFLQYLKLLVNDRSIWLGNVHGKTRPGHKKDTETRIKQSQIIIDFFKNKNGPVIFGGDFNLLPDTKSIQMFEKVGYKNLIKEFGIKSTRNRYTWEQFAKKPGFNKQYFADYCFVSPGLNVKNFEVPNVEVSDHEPLILDFEV